MLTVLMARRRRKRVADQDTLGTAPGKEWDPQLELGSLVFMSIEKNIPHIYEVTTFQRRVLQDHDMYNFPSLAAKGLKVGDEIPPYLEIRRKFTSPFYEPTPRSKVYLKKTDGSKVIKVTHGTLSYMMRNLQVILDGLYSFENERNANDK